MNIDMTQGSTMKSMLRFALPMILGNLLQQCYNIADTLIVGRFLGPNALAAVVYADDLSDLYPFRLVHGKRDIFFHALWGRQ